MKTIARAIVLAAALLTLAAPAGFAALEPGELLEDQALEERARALGQELRCLVCQNQSIDDSDAPLARDLRQLVRERLVAGDSDEAVKAHIVERYGDFVLLRPPFDAGTAALWIGPFAIALLGALLAYHQFRGRAAPVSVDQTLELDDSERARLAQLLDDAPAARTPTDRERSDGDRR